MFYAIEFKPRAIKDPASIEKHDAQRIITKIEALQHDLAGDVKRLTNFSTEYRLRVGNYRVLFELNANRVIIYRVRHRKEAYF